MSATATLRYSTSRKQDNARRVARVVAAARIKADRLAREARMREDHAYALTVAVRWVNEMRAAGAVRIGFKVCHEEGWKQRAVVDVADAARFLAGCIRAGERVQGQRIWNDVEAWGLDVNGEYVGEGW